MKKTIKKNERRQQLQGKTKSALTNRKDMGGNGNIKQ